MPQPVQFAKSGFTQVLSLEKGEELHLLQSAIEQANKILQEEEDVQVSYVKILGDPKNMNCQLQIQDNNGKVTPIDMIALKALDEKTIKSEDDLVTEICNKVKQHLAATKTEGIIISQSGSKFDTRLQRNRIDQDEAGFLTINGNRIAYLTQEGHIPIQTASWRSYTILRIYEPLEIQEEEKKVKESEKTLIIFDDHDLVRKDRDDPIMVISLKTEKFALDQFAQSAQDAASKYQGEYYSACRSKIGLDLGSVLTNWPGP